MTKKPIMQFRNNKELQKSLKEWKKRLFLKDWNIKAVLVSTKENLKYWGLSTFSNKTAYIQIFTQDKSCKNRIAKYCAEKILVHELLHLKVEYKDISSIKEKEKFKSRVLHESLEDMAASLVMAKYGLDFKFFQNKD